MTEVLDLSAIFERDAIKTPDGKTYELRNHQEFGILDDRKLRKMLASIDDLRAKATESDEDAEAAKKMLQDLATMLVVDLKEEIPDWACVAIFSFWVKRAQGEDPQRNPPKPRPKAKPKPKPRPKRTTARSSRASKRSTAATRKTGSRSRPGR